MGHSFARDQYENCAKSSESILKLIENSDRPLSRKDLSIALLVRNVVHTHTHTKNVGAYKLIIDICRLIKSRCVVIQTISRNIEITGNFIAPNYLQC